MSRGGGDRGRPARPRPDARGAAGAGAGTPRDRVPHRRPVLKPLTPVATAWLMRPRSCEITEETVRKKRRAEEEFPAVGAAMPVNWLVRSARFVAIAEVGLFV